MVTRTLANAFMQLRFRALVVFDRSQSRGRRSDAGHETFRRPHNPEMRAPMHAEVAQRIDRFQYIPWRHRREIGTMRAWPSCP